MSKELTHFVGRGVPEEDRYSVLVDSILKGGCLRHSPTSPMECTEVLESRSSSLSIDPNDPDIPPGEIYRSQVVCFCDIPETDLEIHMNKYSHFGLSFLKPFLIEKGASPVFYVAENSPALGLFAGLPNKPAPDLGVPRKQLFLHNIRQFDELLHKLLLGDNPPKWDNGILVPYPDEHQKLATLRSFIQFYVFSFVKCFDNTTSDEDPENFYMEREWRVLGDVKFTLPDLHRIILPKLYAQRLRQDLPHYFGQVTFV
jgi:hypothetical protein